LEEAVEDLVPRFGVELLCQLHRPLHVGEEDGHLFALAFEDASGGEDFVGQMFRRVGARTRWWSCLRGAGSRGFPHSPQNRSPGSLLAPHAAQARVRAAPALGTEFPAFPILATAG